MRVFGVRAAASAVVLIVGGLPAVAQAQLRASLGAEYFSWSESVAPSVKEKGALLSFGLEYTSRADAGFLLGYRGRLYGGTVDYKGSTLFEPRQPIDSTTSYLGTTQEGQLRYRFDVGGDRGLDVVAGVGADLWQRKLSTSQSEDFFIGFARLGLDTERQGEGWMGGGGLKLPFYTYENAHLDALGFSSNPTLKPGKELSAYAHVGYRFDSPLSLILYVDSYRFSQSNAVVVDHPTQGTSLVWQPASTQFSVGLKVRFELQ